jgi:hypothetical protein
MEGPFASQMGEARVRVCLCAATTDATAVQCAGRLPGPRFESLAS